MIHTSRRGTSPKLDSFLTIAPTFLSHTCPQVGTYVQNLFQWNRMGKPNNTLNILEKKTENSWLWQNLLTKKKKRIIRNSLSREHMSI